LFTEERERGASSCSRTRKQCLRGRLNWNKTKKMNLNESEVLFAPYSHSWCRTARFFHREMGYCCECALVLGQREASTVCGVPGTLPGLWQQQSSRPAAAAR
jgi:hypothetical protein